MPFIDPPFHILMHKKLITCLCLASIAFHLFCNMFYIDLLAIGNSILRNFIYSELITSFRSKRLVLWTTDFSYLKKYGSHDPMVK